MAYAADSLIAKILGPLATIPSVSAMGGDPQKWVAKFRQYEPGHYQYGTGQGTNYWANANYYDRAKIYYAWSVADADTSASAEWLRKAHELALNYRQYYAPAGDVSAHWSMPQGIALHFVVTNDAKSKKWVLDVATTFSAPYYYNNLGNLNMNGETDNRIWGRFLEAQILAWLLTGDAKYADLLRNGLTKILSGQNADGGWYFQGPQNGQNKPFMIGVQHDAMILYERAFEKDARIKESIRKACDNMWANQWVAASKSFKYSPGEGAEGNQPAPDLNNLIINGYTYVGQTDRAAQILNGSNAAWLQGDKQFNQQYTVCHNHLATLPGAASAWTGGATEPPIEPPIEPPPVTDEEIEAAKAELQAAQTALTSATNAVAQATTAVNNALVKLS